MISLPLKTKIYQRHDSLVDFITESLQQCPLQEGDVLAITSKIVSLSEGHIVAKESVTDKADLIKSEADVYIGKGAYECHLTIKHGLLIPSAGIDESNSNNGDYILFPKDPFESAKTLYLELKARLNIQNFGVLLTDSHTTPLRRGVTGIALSHFGFNGVKSLVGQADLFGRPLQFTYLNHADALASMAVYEMGEADDRTPLVILRGRKDLEFSDRDTRTDCLIAREDDLYLPLLQSNY